MGPFKVSRGVSVSVLSAVILSALVSCSEPPEDPRGMEWGSIDDEPAVRDTCRTLDDGSYSLPSRFHPEDMTFTGPLFRKSYSKNRVIWSVDVSLPRDGSSDALTVCEVMLNRGQFVESVHLYDLPLTKSS